MKVFVGHITEDRDLAAQIVSGLEAEGINASSGEQISSLFSAMSFGDESIANATRAADCMIAVSSNYIGFKYLVPEMAFFAGNSTADNTVIITKSEWLDRIPPFLSQAEVLLLEDQSVSTLIAKLKPILSSIPTASCITSRQIFLSYSRANVEEARHIYDSLIEKGYDVWFDEESLAGGQDWARVIEKEIRNSGVFLSILSKEALEKRGVFQRELRQALEVAEDMPPGSIYIIPVAVDNEAMSSIPVELSKYHCIYPESHELLRALDFAFNKNV